MKITLEDFDGDFYFFDFDREQLLQLKDAIEKVLNENTKEIERNE